MCKLKPRRESTWYFPFHIHFDVLVRPSLSFNFDGMHCSGYESQAVSLSASSGCGTGVVGCSSSSSSESMSTASHASTPENQKMPPQHLSSTGINLQFHHYRAMTRFYPPHSNVFLYTLAILLYKVRSLDEYIYILLLSTRSLAVIVFAITLNFDGYR